MHEADAETYMSFNPENRQPLQAARAPSKREKATPERPDRSVRFADDDGGKKEVVRVKIVITKKEAARFLSMLAASDDGASKNMQCELEGAGGCSGSPTGGMDYWRPVLESIPESC
ncbi:hypothetical protein C4D60_Mb04t08190 [Musa balbisiana]|uniref:DUF7890 domain-containing protein n=1 Tax=Musa balbisiana TaxID=52838 RepID=A0A4S8KAJ8_MUSBA|nr:hypothetical protein C4D60_Mb04t08190 [Musa balbisiana]